MYGRQKREGELAVLKEREQGAKTTVLRVPLLWVPLFTSDHRLGVDVQNE